MKTIRPDLPTLPARMRKLPVNDAGYPVPWFVEWIDGKPEFRVITADRIRQARDRRLCWICGQKLGPVFAFVLGPMCAVNRTNAEPPNHPDCARFAAIACPFLTRPKAVRREGGLPDNCHGDLSNAPGEAISRNPGACAVWHTKSYELFGDGKGGTLFEIGEPIKVEWFCEGRAAKRSEIEHSISTGLPTLLSMAESEGPTAVLELAKYVQRVTPLLPREPELIA